jgi:hypothetical protein
VGVGVDADADADADERLDEKSPSFQYTREELHAAQDDAKRLTARIDAEWDAQFERARAAGDEALLLELHGQRYGVKRSADEEW